ncbi:hypothetical protein [Fictibacillus sp. JL2B1089]|uniref:hypothetical protein n=1 Tax=Fictibacillus sp. JL2B1089 TaxID=3399565 RepID=UPI003A88CB8B
MVSKKNKKQNSGKEGRVRFIEQLDLISGYVPTGDTVLTGGYIPTCDYEFTGSYVSTGDYELTGGYIPTCDYEFTGSYIPTGDYRSADMTDLTDDSEKNRIFNVCFEELQIARIFTSESSPRKHSSPKGYLKPPII